MRTFIGIFDNSNDARRAMEMLRDSGLALDDLSIISRASKGEVEISSADDVSAGQGAAVGAVWGGLVGLATLVIPGVGPFIAGGALFAALTGIITGAVVGGVAAALMEFGGIPEEEARSYETLVYKGKTLVAVKAREEDARHVQRLLNKAGAEAVRGPEAVAGVAPTSPVQVAMYDESGRRVELDNQAAVSGAASTRGIYDMPAANQRTVG